LYEKSIGILGGDMRHFHLYKLVLGAGFDAKIFGFDNLCPNTPINDVLCCHKLVLPIPTSRDGVSINAPYSSEEIPIDSIIGKIGKNTVVYGGIIKGALNDLNQTVIDYYSDEKFTGYNAILTAEGAIGVIMNNTETALTDCRILIVGYGRIGRYTAGLLKGFNADITVSARKEQDFKDIALHGLKSINTNNLSDEKLDFNIILNTVPNRLFGKEIIEKLPCDCLFIELASPPYSIDFALAAAMGLNVLNAQSLPSKYAPFSCAKALLSIVTAERRCSLLRKDGDNNG